MNTKTTVVLLVLLVLMGVAVWWATRGGGPDGPEDAGGYVLAEEAFDWAGLERVEAVVADGEGVRREAVAMVDGRWWQVEPARFRMRATFPEPGGFDALLAAAQQSAVRERFAAGDADRPALAAVGLDPPAATVRLVTAGGAVTVAVGDVRPGGLGYVRVDGGDVLLTDAAWQGLVGEAWAVYRRTDLEPAAIDRATRVTVVHPGGPPVLAREGGRWWVVEPARGAADTRAVGEALRRLMSAQVLGYIDDAPERPDDYGLGAGAAVVRFALPAVEGGATGAELRIGRAVDVSGQAYFAQWSPDVSDPRGAVIALPAEAVLPFLAPAESWVDPRVVRTPAADRVSAVWTGADGVEAVLDAAGLEGWVVERFGAVAGVDRVSVEGGGVLGTLTVESITGLTERVAFHAGGDDVLAVHEGEGFALRVDLAAGAAGGGVGSDGLTP